MPAHVDLDPDGSGFVALDPVRGYTVSAEKVTGALMLSVFSDLRLTTRRCRSTSG